MVVVMNERTVMLHLRRAFQPEFDKLVGAELVAEAQRLRMERHELPASAVLVYCRDAESVTMTRVIHHPPEVDAPAALVAGRHSECDLGRIPGASLRHALILLWPPTGDRELPFAEVIDLGTQTGIALPDGRLAMRVASSESLRFGVADADVVIVHARGGEPLPLEPADLARLRCEVPERAEVATHDGRPYTRHLNVGTAGDVTVPGEVSGTAEAGAAAADDHTSCEMIPVEPSGRRTFGAEHAMLTQYISLGGHLSAKVNVRAEDLERGVRLGRYLRCRGASVLGRDGHVSRVHALVLDRGGRRWLFDTASTNGTFVVDVESGVASGPVRGERTFALLEGQAPALAGQVALVEVGTPSAPS
jgi:FHA domain